MLDAFGKGASEDIQLAKSELYSQMTWDKDSKSSAFAEPQVTTTLPSPPPSPKPRKASLEDTSKQSQPSIVSKLRCFQLQLLSCSYSVAVIQLQLLSCSYSVAVT